jgi:hypothetical protein
MRGGDERKANRAGSGPKRHSNYIAGMGRSGSTLLARLLGEIDGVFNAGEAFRVLLDARMMRRNLPCGCGKAVDRCPFWGPILPFIQDSIQTIGAETLRLSKFPLLAISPESIRPGTRMGKILEAMEQLYARIAEHSGTQVVVDSSKHPTHAIILSRSGIIQSVMAHLVRDPRGVLSSRMRAKGYLPPLSAPKVVQLWTALNLCSEMAGRLADRYRRVRYEDLARNPEGVLGLIVKDLQKPREGFEFLDETSALFGTQHMLAGNPDKLETGPTQIRYQSWNLPWYLDWVTWLATSPLALRYGYRWSGRL